MLERYRSALGIIYLVVGTSTLLVALTLPWVVVVTGLLAADAEPSPLTACASLLAASWLVITAAAAIVAGTALLCRQSWATSALAVAAVVLLWILPVGTIVGVLTLWVLRHDRRARRAGTGSR